MGKDERGDRYPLGPLSKRERRQSGDNRIALRIAMDHYEKHPDGPKPVLDVGTDHVSSGGCGDVAAHQTARMLVRESRKGHDSRTHQESSNSQLSEQGWIMTMALGPYNDLGDPFDHAYEQKYSSRPYEIAPIPDFKKTVSAIVNFLTGHSMSFDDIQRLYGFYKEKGVDLGVSGVRGIDEEMRLKMRKYSKDRKREVLRKKMMPALEAIAWYIREGAEDALDAVTEIYGRELIDIYLTDVREIMKMRDDDGKKSDLVEAVKRVNAAYASLVVNEKADATDSNFPKVIQQDLSSEGLIEAIKSEGIEVANDESHPVILGIPNITIDTHRRKTIVAKAIDIPPLHFGRVIADGTFQMYKTVLIDLIEHARSIRNLDGKSQKYKDETGDGETYRVGYPNLPFTRELFRRNLEYQVQEIPNIYVTDKGSEFLSRYPGLAQAIRERRFQGDILRFVTDKDSNVVSLVVRPHIYYDQDGISHEISEPIIAKYSYPTFQDSSKMKYTPAVWEQEFLEVVKNSLPSEFRVVEPLFATGEVLVMPDVGGDVSLREFYSDIFYDRVPQLRSYRLAILESIRDITDVAKEVIKNGLLETYSQIYSGVARTSQDHVLTIQNNKIMIQLCLDLAERQDLGDANRRFHGYEHWRLDEERFINALARREEEIRTNKGDHFTYYDIRSALLESVVFFDPIYSEWAGKDGDYLGGIKVVDNSELAYHLPLSKQIFPK